MEVKCSGDREKEREGERERRCIQPALALISRSALSYSSDISRRQTKFDPGGAELCS